MHPNFIHLHIHSEYSIIDGIASIKSLVQRAADLNFPSIAITDFTNLYCLVKFYNLSEKFGIKPIIGADFLCKHVSLKENFIELTILALNNIGFNNLKLLIYEAYNNKFNIKKIPSINLNLLIKYKEGLIILSNYIRGDIGYSITNKNIYDINFYLKFYKKYFSERFYLEITRLGHSYEKENIKYAIDISLSNNIPLVATNNVRFIYKKDFDVHEIKVAIHDGIILNKLKDSKKYSKKQYLAKEENMAKLFSDIPEALFNSVEIAKRCNVNISFNKYYLPIFYKKKVNNSQYLMEKSLKGLKNRLKVLFPKICNRNIKKKIYYKRLYHELKVINNMGFSSYFLIVMEFVQWAKNNNIPVGPGRGSGAGSLVAYSINITDIDPIYFNLIFERFLNSERLSMPDFDIDFCMEKRDLVINHISKLYGKNYVSQIITFGTLTAKAAVKDVGRVLGYSYSFIHKISKLIPYDIGITLNLALKSKFELQTLYNSNDDVKIIIDTAKKIEGIIRNIGKHSGGLVISPSIITDFIPIHKDKNNNQITQFDKIDIEKIGLIKFDILGLRTLTIIDSAVTSVNKIYRHKKKLNILNIPLNDKKSFKILKKGKTTAVFQLESYGMKDLIYKLKPDSFEDIIALLALFRPGPLKSGMVENFINRKQGKEKISYPDHKWQNKLLIPILKSTYGIILYQEQVIQIVQILANYTLGEADILRRTISKKQHKDIIRQKNLFQKKAIKNKINSKFAIKIFDLLEKFSGYSFNKSHSAAYALISYQTLWLKANYPINFMVASLNSDIDNIDRISILISECKNMKLIVLPPDINNSEYLFKINKNNEILFGLGAIKGIGAKVVKLIIESRIKYGIFTSLNNLCYCIKSKQINKKCLEKLIFSGSCDSLDKDRITMLNKIEYALKYSDQANFLNISKQKDLFETDLNIVDKYYKYSNKYNINKYKELKNEKSLLGVYLTGHPISEYLEELKYYVNLEKIENNRSIIFGMISHIKIFINSKKKNIGFISIENSLEKIDLIILDHKIKQYKSYIKQDAILIIEYNKISYNLNNNYTKFYVQKITDIIQARKKYLKGIIIKIKSKKLKYLILEKIFNCLKKYMNNGFVQVYLYNKDRNKITKSILNTKFIVYPKNKLFHDIEKITKNKIILKF